MKQLIFFCLLFPGLASAQIFKSKVELDRIREANYLDQEDYRNTIFYIIQQGWTANMPISTASAITNGVFPIQDRRVPMKDNEGESNDYLLEADLYLSYPLIYGRKEYGVASNKLARIAFDYGVNFRMLYDNSSPVTPPSQKPGLSYQMNLYNNYSKWFGSSWKKNSKDSIYRLKPGKNLTFVNFLFKVQHYSNGQSGDSIYIEPESGLERNNYRDGDFSTNYLYFQTTLGKYHVGYKNLHQLSVGYRWDWGSSDGTFAYSGGQDFKYGRNRLTLIYDYRSSPRQDIPWHFRADFNYIIGDLGEFQANIDSDKKYRTGAKLFFALTPKYHRSVGYFVSTYYGRDYLNIRYDDIVFVFRIGLSLSLDGYKINKAKNVMN
ncbi:hypothetical protein RM549_09735 [Salegentibacter sp. F188]|uniref:DUF4421 domain-containing protein n=1 Tax=Autumnicola patrickiae TaxID=3075591 RepID=A0ABU3E245_9FLAO|nr:hypothetical protein [Salegentibacter sp. F188]MDT0690064.1 hypothetical protein [Salegentibacter sp. F188]